MAQPFAVLIGVADSQTLSAFGSSSFQNQASVLGCHAGPESVLVFSFPVAGLKCSFHFKNSVYTLFSENRKFSTFSTNPQGILVFYLIFYQSGLWKHTKKAAVHHFQNLPEVLFNIHKIKIVGFNNQFRSL